MDTIRITVNYCDELDQIDANAKPPELESNTQFEHVYFGAPQQPTTLAQVLQQGVDNPAIQALPVKLATYIKLNILHSQRQFELPDNFAVCYNLMA